MPAGHPKAGKAKFGSCWAYWSDLYRVQASGSPTDSVNCVQRLVMYRPDFLQSWAGTFLNFLSQHLCTETLAIVAEQVVSFFTYPHPPV